MTKWDTSRGTRGLFVKRTRIYFVVKRRLTGIWPVVKDYSDIVRGCVCGEVG